MKVGVLICGYDCAAEIEEVLKPWQEAKQSNLGGHEFVLSMVYGQFKEWAELFGDKPNATAMLSVMPGLNLDSFVFAGPADEATIRNAALQPLLDAGCDVIWLLDADEYYTTANIEEALKIMALCPWEAWFKISFKNYVFTKKKYLIDPFQPPRIFRVNTCGYKLEKFYYDNDVTYKGTIVEGNAFVEKVVSYKELPSKTIPQHKVWVRHYSWLNDERSKKKVQYQEKHFAHGAGCSFKWDEFYNSLDWNMEFFKKTGQTVPMIAND